MSQSHTEHRGRRVSAYQHGFAWRPIHESSPVHAAPAHHPRAGTRGLTVPGSRFSARTRPSAALAKLDGPVATQC